MMLAGWMAGVFVFVWVRYEMYTCKSYRNWNFVFVVVVAAAADKTFSIWYNIIFIFAVNRAFQCGKKKKERTTKNQWKSKEENKIKLEI